MQQSWTRHAMAKIRTEIALPCEITLTRLSPRTLDKDNLPTAFKYVIDELAEILMPEYKASYVNKKGKRVQIKGRADADPRITWHYRQEKNHFYGIRIEISWPASENNLNMWPM